MPYSDLHYHAGGVLGDLGSVEDVCLATDWEGLPEYIHQVVKVALKQRSQVTSKQEQVSGEDEKHRETRENISNEGEGSWEVMQMGEVNWRKNQGWIPHHFLARFGSCANYCTTGYDPRYGGLQYKEYRWVVQGS